MQTWTATISQIQDIPGKDRIGLATVNGYQAIIAKADYQVGDLVVYISEQSIVPDELLEEIGLTGKLSGSGKNRVKAIKMGGVVSQGIVCRPADWELAGRPQGDVDDLLKITKWEPEIPLSMSGKIARPRGNAPITPMYDIENIKKQRHMRMRYDDQGNIIGDYWYDPFEGYWVQVTEKLHGTNYALHMNQGEFAPYVYSKGLGKQGFVLEDTEGNVYWKATHMYPELVTFLEETLKRDESVSSITVRGEVIGQGVQDLDYGIPFDLAVFAIEEHGPYGEEDSTHPNDWYTFPDTVPVIPIMWEGQYDYDKIVAMATGMNEYGKPGTHVREGVVCVCDTRFRQTNGMRFAAKFINPDYLTRKGGTEYN